MTKLSFAIKMIAALVLISNLGCGSVKVEEKVPSNCVAYLKQEDVDVEAKELRLCVEGLHWENPKTIEWTPTIVRNEWEGENMDLWFMHEIVEEFQYKGEMVKTWPNFQNLEGMNPPLRRTVSLPDPLSEMSFHVAWMISKNDKNDIPGLQLLPCDEKVTPCKIDFVFPLPPPPPQN